MSTPTPVQASPTGSTAEVARRPRGSLARQTLIRTGAGLAVVIVALTAISCYQVRSTVTRQAIDDLRTYIKLRGEREQAIFDLAIDNHQAIKEELVRRIHDYDADDPEPEFQRRYTLYPDGAMRSRREIFDPARTAGVTIINPAVLDDDLKLRVLAAQDTIEQMGRALHPRFQITWMVMPENLTIGYWPEQPESTFLMNPKTDFTAGWIFRSASPAQNPERKGIWSGVYNDETTRVDMVSLSTPVYNEDRFIGIIGHDVTVAEFLNRTVNVRLEGTYNLIVERDGGLIAHPALVEALEKRRGRRKYRVSDAGDPKLQSIYETALTLQGKSDVLEDAGSDAYLGVVRIGGPEWYLVTVYPKALLQAAAFRTARFVLFGGLVALLLEMAILLLVFRRQVAAPLASLLGATKQVASGDMDVEVDARRDDELGELAASFNAMAAAVRDREERNELLTREIAANLNREIEKNEQLELLWATVEVLSAPVLPIWNNVLVLPVIGSVDDRRVAVMMEKLLAEVVRVQSRFVIIDVTGMTAIDAPTADRLLKLVRAVRLLGARCMLTGLRSSMASALVENEIEFADLDTLGTLESGLRDCLQRLAAERGRRPRRPAGKRLPR